MAVLPPCLRRGAGVLFVGVLLALSGCGGRGCGRDGVPPMVDCDTTSTHPVIGVAFSADGRFLAAGVGEPGTRERWKGGVLVANATSGEILASKDYPEAVRCLAICPDSSGVWVGFGNVETELFPKDGARERIWIRGGALRRLDLPTLQEQKSLDVGCVNALAISPDGKVLSALTTNRNMTVCRLLLWDTETMEQRRPIEYDGCTYGQSYRFQRLLAFAPDGKLLAVAVGAKQEEPGQVMLWDVQKNAKASSVPVPKGPPTCVSFSPDSAQLAIVTQGGVVVADVKSATVSRTFTLATYHGADLEWLPGQPNLVYSDASTRPTRAGLFDASTEQWPLQFVASSRACATSLAVSSDGNLLAAGDDHGHVHIWGIPRP